jgi:hypothetical protein
MMIRAAWVVLLTLVCTAGCGTTATQEQQKQTAGPSVADHDADPTGDETAADPVVETPKEQESRLVEREFTYDPGGRRDPFVSPAEALAEELGPRPTGIAGMSVDDLDFTGVVSTPTGAVANVTGPDGQSYFLRVGDRIYRAVVLAIDPEAGTITFREQVDDPNSIKPYRDRVLRLESWDMSP